MSIAEFVERYEERINKIYSMAVEALQKQRSSAIEKIKEEKTETAEVAPAAKHELEVPFESEEDYETVGGEPAVKAEVATPPEPVATKPRPISEGGAEKGKISKSKLIREFFEKHPEAANKACIEFYKKKNIEIKPALVSTVKINMESSKTPRRRRGRPSKSELRGRAVAVAKKAKKRGLPMPACLTKVMSKSKHGMQVDEILKGVKKYYTYSGAQGDVGLKNVINQTLNSLSKAKPRRGWKSDAPVILHDDRSHTWRLNPKAERRTA